MTEKRKSMILDDLNLHDSDIDVVVEGDRLLLFTRHHATCTPNSCTYVQATCVFEGVTDLKFKAPAIEMNTVDGREHQKNGFLENATISDLPAHARSWIDHMNEIHGGRPEEAKEWAEHFLDTTAATRDVTIESFIERLAKTRMGNGMSVGVADQYTPKTENYIQLDMHCDWRMQFRYKTVVIKTGEPQLSEKGA